MGIFRFINYTIIYSSIANDVIYTNLNKEKADSICFQWSGKLGVFDLGIYLRQPWQLPVFLQVE